MTLASALRDLFSFSVQGALIVAVAALFARVLPVDRPRLKLAWWQAVLVATLVLPFLGPFAPLPGADVDIRLGAAVPTFAQAAPLGASWAEVVGAVLVGGVFLQTVRLARGLSRLRACRGRAVPFEAAALDGISESIGARALVCISPDVAVPATFGFQRPMVLLPESVREMTPESQRAIVAHELVHVRRHDWPVAVAEEVLTSALWFHPAVHVLVGRIRLAREQCVDAAVVATLGGRREYLEALLEVARWRSSPDPAPAALFLGERHLVERVNLLLREVAMSKVRALFHLCASALAVVLAAAVASSSLPLSVSAHEGDESKSAPAEKTGVGEPRLIHKVNPAYPPEAKKERIEGLVHIDTRLAKDGSVAEAIATDGHPILAEAAVAAVRQWRYEPVLGRDKKPVEFRLTITINFRLSD